MSKLLENLDELIDSGVAVVLLRDDKTFRVVAFSVRNDHEDLLIAAGDAEEDGLAFAMGNVPMAVQHLTERNSGRGGDQCDH